MTTHEDQAEQVGELLATPDLAGALESEQFRRFLDQIPIAIVVSEIKSRERVVYANPDSKNCPDRLPPNLKASHGAFCGVRPRERIPNRNSGRPS